MSNIALNKEQLEAVSIVNGPVMVFAGAGTGKTRTLISRIVNLIENHGIMPYNILAITFTKKIVPVKIFILQKITHALCACIICALLILIFKV